jgi:hypothetical protein
MNSEELAILRILFKHRTAMKVSILLDGFPDRSEQAVNEAILRLYGAGFILFTNSPSCWSVGINSDKRRIVFDILNSSCVSADSNELGKEFVNISERAIGEICRKEFRMAVPGSRKNKFAQTLQQYTVLAAYTLLILSATALGVVFFSNLETLPSVSSGVSEVFNTVPSNNEEHKFSTVNYHTPGYYTLETGSTNYEMIVLDHPYVAVLTHQFSS